MPSLIRLVMQKFYRKAEGQPERLPWHQEDPPPILTRAASQRGGRGRAFDVGCGAGVFSVWLAEQGFAVTGIDLFPEATGMARARAEKHGVTIELVTADLFSYAPERPFDLVFDSGCLHSLVGGDVDSYKRQLLQWTAAGSDYVLGHWGKRNWMDWRPVGPKRRTEAAVRKIFEPDFRLLDLETTDFAAPMPFGPVVRGVGYWFRRGA
ncbi:MAG TPA: class I SAM-dependent methyltransferase [Thermoanaerobaculia bacterium]